MRECLVSDLANVNPPLSRVPADQIAVGFIAMGDISEAGGIVRRSEVPFGTVKTGFTRFQNGDILFAKITPCMENGKGALVSHLPNGVGCGSTEFHVLRAKDTCCAAFLYQYLQSPALRQEAERYMSGSAGQQRVPAEFFRRLRISAPSFALQEKIAAILTSLDTTIEKTEALIEKHQQIKAGLMHDVFARGLLPDGHLRPSHQTRPDLYRRSPVGWIPTNWQYELLDRLAIRGSGHTPNKDFSEYWNGGVKWVSLADSHRLDQLYISDTALEISEKGIQNSSAVLHPAGTVVLSRDAGIGKSAITTQPMAVSQHFMCWRCADKMDKHFLYYWLQFNKRTFENIAMGSTILTIGLPYFKKLRIACPVDLVEQRKIAEQLKGIDEVVFTLTRHLEKAKAQKLGLMQSLLTGKLQVAESMPLEAVT